MTEARGPGQPVHPGIDLSEIDPSEIDLSEIDLMDGELPMRASNFITGIQSMPVVFESREV